jgi:hypothetical protein
MTAREPSQRGFGKSPAIVSLGGVAMVIALYFYGGTLLQFAREALMRRATSAHYEILCLPWALSPNSVSEFAAQREFVFKRLNKKLGDAGSNVEIRIVFNPNYSVGQSSEAGARTYSVTGTTIRTKLIGRVPQLPDAADAEALLHATWGKSGNEQITKWIALCLVGQSAGTDLGMVAAQVEQRLGHKTVESLLADPGGEISSVRDRDALGAAWISELSEFGGTGTVKKLYAADIAHPNIAEVTKALSTTPLELDRKWQLWMYAYLAGMSSMPSDSAMPMDMPMPGGNQ